MDGTRKFNNIMGGGVVRGGANYKDSRLNLSRGDRMKMIEESASRVMSLDATMESNGYAYPISPSNLSFIGQRGMYVGSRVHSGATNKRTGSRTNSAVSGSTGSKRKTLKDKFKERPKYEPITIEPRPSQRADDWMTHGNSIGNGILITLGPVDPDELTLLRLKNKDFQANRAERQKLYFEQRRAEKQRQMDVMLRKKAMKQPPPALASFSSMSGKGRKQRPVSPIEYDFRGRRVTPKKEKKPINQDMQAKNTNTQTTADATYRPDKSDKNHFSGASKGKITVKALLQRQATHYIGKD